MILSRYFSKGYKFHVKGHEKGAGSDFSVEQAVFYNNAMMFKLYM